MRSPRSSSGISRQSGRSAGGRCRCRGDSRTWPTVDVFIPTYNEPLTVVRATVLSALAMDYPAHKMNVIVLDDGRRDQFRDFAAAIGVGYLTRETNAHAKAGNLNHALAHTRVEFIAIFDADHIPTRCFLRMTLGPFLRDPRMGLVQTPHHFYSPDPIRAEPRNTSARFPTRGSCSIDWCRTATISGMPAFFAVRARSCGARRSRRSAASRSRR